MQRVAVQFSSVAQSCPTPCNPMNCSTAGLPVHHQLRTGLKLRWAGSRTLALQSDLGIPEKGFNTVDFKWSVLGQEEV